MRPVSPEVWASTLSGPPDLTSPVIGERSGFVRRWRGTSGIMAQPPLDHHYVVLHLGGPKRVTRIGDGEATERDVEPGDLTIVPAGTVYEWRTIGPIDFAHLYVHPSRLAVTAEAATRRRTQGLSLSDAVGMRDPLLSLLIQEMLEEGGRDPANSLHLEALFETAIVRLACRHLATGPRPIFARHAIAPARLRRVLDFIDASLDGPITLDDLAEVAGLSRFHFSRSFRTAMAVSPAAYVTGRRLEEARRLLRETSLAVWEIGRRCGYGSAAQFCAAFRRETGVPPSDYRRALL